MSSFLEKSRKNLQLPIWCRKERNGAGEGNYRNFSQIICLAFRSAIYSLPFMRRLPGAKFGQYRHLKVDFHSSPIFIFIFNQFVFLFCFSTFFNIGLKSNKPPILAPKKKKKNSKKLTEYKYFNLEI